MGYRSSEFTRKAQVVLRILTEDPSRLDSFIIINCQGTFKTGDGRVLYHVMLRLNEMLMAKPVTSIRNTSD